LMRFTDIGAAKPRSHRLPRPQPDDQLASLETPRPKPDKAPRQARTSVRSQPDSRHGSPRQGPPHHHIQIRLHLPFLAF
jgi:hypothetical protein